MAALKFTRQGYGELRTSAGVVISRHTVAEEAYERAASMPAGVYVYVPAPIKIEVAANAPAPAPAPNPPTAYFIDGTPTV